MTRAPFFPRAWRNACRLAAGWAFASGVALAALPPAPALDRVVLQLKWLHQFQFAGYYAAVSQGYYRDAGLDVELREATPGRDPISEVLEGRAQFGVGTSELTLLRDKGKPVVVLAVVYQHSPLVLLARRSPGIDDLQALHDQPMMIEPDSAELFAYFKNEGVDRARLILKEHTFDVRDLIEGRVEGMSAYSTDEPYLLKQAGVDFLSFTPRAGGIDFYGDNLFTTEEQILLHPERVRAFRQASLRGWEYAMAHSTEIVDLILRDYSRRKSRGHLLFEARQTFQLIHPELIEIGHMNPGRWRHMADTYAEFGMLSRSFSLDGFLYDPNPRANLAWLYWLLAVSTAIAVAALGWALPIFRLNRRLQREIAERRKGEEKLRIARDAAEAANRAKGHYLAVMTHEVRTPLGGIISAIDLLRASALSAEQREDADLIAQSAQALMKLSGDVLDFEKIEAGAVELEHLGVDLRKLVREVSDIFQAQARAKNLLLRHSIQPGVPPIIITDPTRLRQILVNLVSNAVKFTLVGEIELTVIATPVGSSVAPSGFNLSFRVRDTGCGIAAEEIGRLFEVYAQAEASVSRRFGGTGLGLAIAQRLARLLGGGISVESTPGSGSVFTATIVAAAGF